MNFACFLLNHEMYKKQTKRKITFVNENEIPKQDTRQGEARLIFIIQHAIFLSDKLEKNSNKKNILKALFNTLWDLC